MKKCPKCEEPILDYSDLCPHCYYMPREIIKKTKQLTVSTFITCKHCMRRIVLNGPRQQVQCNYCLKIQELDPRHLALALSEASKGSQIVSGTGAEYTILIHDAPGPWCTSCGGRVPILEQIVNLEKGQAIRCRSCGIEVPYYDAPRWMKLVLPNAVSIINAEKEEVDRLPVRTLLLACISCGAALRPTTGDERLMTCGYCGRNVYLSDDAWRILHSVDTTRSWSVTYTKKWLQSKSIKYRDFVIESVPESKLGFVTIDMHTSCMYCGVPLMVNGPARTIRCLDCGKVTRIRKRVLAEHIAVASTGSRWLIPNFTVRIHESHQPQCHRCGNPVEILGYAVQGDSTKPLLCGNCGEELPQFPVPGWLRRLLPKARHLFGAESEERQNAPESAGDRDPVTFMMSCETCGAENELTVNTGSTRLFECSSCRASILLPSVVWQRFHPVRQLTRWTLSYKLPQLYRRVWPPERIYEFVTWNLHWYLGDAWEAVQPHLKRLFRSKIFKRKRALSVIVKIRCQKCGRPVPVNGPMQSVLCSACMQENRLTPDRLGEKLAWASEDMGALFDWDFTVEHWWKRNIPCNECSEPVDIPISKLAAGKRVEVPCGSCGAIMEGGPPPGWLHEVLPDVLGIFNTVDEEQKGLHQAAIERERETVAGLNCPGCGMSISIDSQSGRTVTCTMCESEVYLPDRLWHMLHPVTTSRRWTLIFRGSKIPEP